MMITYAAATTAAIAAAAAANTGTYGAALPTLHHNRRAVQGSYDVAVPRWACLSLPMCMEVGVVVYVGVYVRLLPRAFSAAIYGFGVASLVEFVLLFKVFLMILCCYLRHCH